MKKAKLVQVVFTTRVIVNEDNEGNFDYDKMVEDVTNNLRARIDNDEVEENIETYFDDDECPYECDEDESWSLQGIIRYYLMMTMDDESARIVAENITKDVIKDLRECADKDYNDSDIHLAIGRVLAKASSKK